MKKNSESHDEKLKRLHYQSVHRGCKETDYILGAFAHTHLASLDEEELVLYEALLSENDWDIFAWVVGNEPFPERYLNSSLPKRLTEQSSSDESK